MEQTFTNYLLCVPGIRMNWDEYSEIGVFPSKKTSLFRGKGNLSCVHVPARDKTLENSLMSTRAQRYHSIRKEWGEPAILPAGGRMCQRRGAMCPGGFKGKQRFPVDRRGE